MKLSNILKSLAFLSFMTADSKVGAYYNKEVCNTLFDESCPLSRPCMNAETMDVISGMAVSYGTEPLLMVDYVAHTCEEELEARAVEIANAFMEGLEKRMEEKNIRFSFEDDFRDRLSILGKRLWQQTAYNAFGLVARLKSPFVSVQETMEYADSINLLKLGVFNRQKSQIDRGFVELALERLDAAFAQDETTDLSIDDLTDQYVEMLGQYVEDLRFNMPENKTMMFSQAISAQKLHQGGSLILEASSGFDYTTKPKNRTKNTM